MTKGRTELPRWATDLLQTLPPLLTREGAAQTLGVAPVSIDRRIRRRELSATKHGARVLVPRLALVEYLVARTA
jgi:hypothetical protein